MEASKVKEHYRRIWEAAIRSAAGPLSAYVTPRDYGLSALRVAASEVNEPVPFEQELLLRIELGRALQFIGLLKLFDPYQSQTYKHHVVNCDKHIRGALHVPRLIALRARGQNQTLPSRLAIRHLATPENLFASEILETSRRVLQVWRNRGGAEADAAVRALAELQDIASRAPWSELRYISRPSVREAAALIKARTKAGWQSEDSVASQLADVALARGQQLIESAAGLLSFLGAEDERFADKLFELLCIGWFVKLLTTELESVICSSEGIRDSSKAIVAGLLGEVGVEFRYQVRFGAGNAWQWSSGKELVGIPDFLLICKSGAGQRIILLDAKNRVRSSETEVAYKLLGYKENLRVEPFVAIALFPEFEGPSSTRFLRSDNSHVVLARVSLQADYKELKELALQVLDFLKPNARASRIS